MLFLCLGILFGCVTVFKSNLKSTLKMPRPYLQLRRYPPKWDILLLNSLSLEQSLLNRMAWQYEMFFLLLLGRGLLNGRKLLQPEVLEINCVLISPLTRFTSSSKKGSFKENNLMKKVLEKSVMKLWPQETKLHS